MRDDTFSQLVDEIDAHIAKRGDEKLALELVGRFSANVRELRPSTATAFMALAMLVRSAVPEDETQAVWLTAFARAVADIEIVRHPDGSPVLHEETPAVLQ